jgi:hypothetical protein
VPGAGARLKEGKDGVGMIRSQDERRLAEETRQSDSGGNDGYRRPGRSEAGHCRERGGFRHELWLCVLP